MITITKDNEFTTVEELRQGLLDVIKTELEEYSPEDTGWTNYSVDEIYTLVDRYLNEVTDAEIDEYNEDCGYEDRDEAIMCYINEWAF
jgi:hypothetical protein